MSIPHLSCAARAHRITRSLARRSALVAALLAWCGGSVARAELANPSPAANANFGRSVAIAIADGNSEIMAVGAPGIVGSTTAPAGRVYIFRRDFGDECDPTWLLETTLVGSDTVAGDGFGSEVSLQHFNPSGSSTANEVVLVVGAPGDDAKAGSAYVFRRTISGGGTWTQEGKLVQPARQPGDFFGECVAIAPDLSQIAVGAPLDYPTGPGGAAPSVDPGNLLGVGRGQVSVFKRSGSNWFLSATASAPASVGNFDRMGDGLAYGHDVGTAAQLMIGSPGATQSGFGNAGQVRVVQELTPGVWSLQTTLNGTINSTSARAFGAAIRRSGTRAVVSAPETGPGRVLVFKRTGTVWAFESICELPAEIASTPDARFGNTLAMSGDLIATGSSTSRAFLFRAFTGVSTLPVSENYIDPGAPAPAIFESWSAGIALSSIEELAIGIPGRDNFGSQTFIDGGRVDLFDAVPVGQFTADVPESTEEFGSAIALGTARAVVGKPGSDNGTSGSNRGGVEVFERTSGIWRRIANFEPTTITIGSRLGSAVAMTIDDTRAAVGSPEENGGATQSGRVYAGSITGTGATFSPLPNPAVQAGERLGTSVALVGNTTTTFVVGGSPEHDATLTIANSGRVVVWRNGTVFQSIVSPTPQANGRFGASVAIEMYSDQSVDLWVGAPAFDPPGASVDSGAVFLFRKSPTGTQFVLVGGPRNHEAFLTTDDLAGSNYGATISCRKSQLVVGAPAWTPFDNRGAVFAFRRDASANWNPVANGVLGSIDEGMLGASVSSNGSSMLVGRPGTPAAPEGLNGGVAIQYKISGSSLVLVGTLVSGECGTRLGVAVALGGGTTTSFLTGAPFDDAYWDGLREGTAFGSPGPDNPCAADVNADGSNDAADLGLVLASWGTTGDTAPGSDINVDGVVNALDLSLLLSLWGPCAN